MANKREIDGYIVDVNNKLKVAQRLGNGALEKDTRDCLTELNVAIGLLTYAVKLLNENNK